MKLKYLENLAKKNKKQKMQNGSVTDIVKNNNYNNNNKSPLCVQCEKKNRKH